MTTDYERRGAEVTPGELPHAMRAYNMLGYPVQGYMPQPNNTVVVVVNAPVGCGPLPDWRSAYSQPHPPAYQPRPVPAKALVILLALLIVGAGLVVGARAMGALPWQQDAPTLAGVPVETGGMALDAPAQWPWQAGFTWPWERAAQDAADAAEAVQGTVTTVSTAVLAVLVLLIILALVRKWRR